MVTARAEPEAGFVDEGRGLPEVEAALRWLLAGRSGSDVQVRVPGSLDTAAWIERGPKAADDSVVRFELTRERQLRAPRPTPFGPTFPGCARPLGSRSTARSAEVKVPYSSREARAPGAYTGTVTGWTGDTLAGPGVPARGHDGEPGELRRQRAAPGGHPGPGRRCPALVLPRRHARGRSRCRSRPAQPDQGIAFLHEPEGMPFRDGSAVPVGQRRARSIPWTARDVRNGVYEIGRHAHDVAGSQGDGGRAPRAVRA